MKNISTLALSLILSVITVSAFAQDTLKVQTFSYSSLTRDTIIEFPNTGDSYEKIIMSYNMRCHDATISGSGNNNGPHQGGCGEWDYSCNTYITDSTRIDSLLSFTPSHSITGFSGTTYYYSNTPTYSYVQTTQKDVTVNSSTPTNHSVVTGASNITDILNTSNFSGKSQFLFTSTELSAAGLTTGNVYGMNLDINSTSSDANFMRVRLLNTTKTALSPTNVDVAGFTEVYYNNTNFVSGANYLQFHSPFNWDNTKNVIVEISFTNSTASLNTEFQGGNTGLNSTLIAGGNNYAEFTGGEELQISTTNMSSITNEITVSAWTYGSEDIMPADSYLFQALDSDGNRTVSVHLPWSNGNIYWDCGNNGGTYDRMEKSAITSEYEGRWNHWAFTKNASTGDMKIYLNGALWHSGTGKILPMDIQTFSIGNTKYYGFIDEFRVWNKELSQSNIQAWMNTSLDGGHPNYANLVAYYNLNEGNGTTANDSSPNAKIGTFYGGANWKSDRGDKIDKFFTVSSNRPNITFTQGVFDITTTDVTVLDSLELVNIVTEHGISPQYNSFDTDIITDISTANYWPAGNFPILDESGNQIGTKNFGNDGSITPSELEYFRRYPSQFEIMSLVTPYGNGLDLGQNGKTFLFDVTDFTPILEGKKRMYITGGAWQEELDVEFHFIKGTPIRDVIDIQQIWKVSSQSYANISNERVFETRDLKLNSSGKSFKVRSAITGHGQEGEFISRSHSLNINGGATEFSWDVWKECAENPIYPQGGTWPLDRAGWCPGMATDIEESILDEYVSGGDVVSFDYNVSSATGDSRYFTNHQLVTYNTPNFSLDAAIINIQYPNNKRVEFERYNPICSPPRIEIQNTGSTELTSLTIEYNVKGGDVKTFDWTGNLAFLETTEVDLPVDNISFWDSGSGEQTFEAKIKEPNGGNDEYAQNNTYKTTYNLFDRFTDIMQLEFRTNNSPNQNSWKILNSNGELVMEHKGFSANTTIKEEIHVDPGCYTLEFYDTGDNGLSIWYQPEQGSGYLRFKYYDPNLDFFKTAKTFEPDFGKVTRYSFHSEGLVNIKESENHFRFSIYPNPTNDEVNIDFEGKTEEIQIEVHNQLGQVIYSEAISSTQSMSKQINLRSEAPGIYFVKVKFGDEFRTQKVIKQ